MCLPYLLLHVVYVEYSDVKVYFQDAVRRMIQTREEQPVQFFRDYFKR
jgi:hypothetical protein